MVDSATGLFHQLEVRSRVIVKAEFNLDKTALGYTALTNQLTNQVSYQSYNSTVVQLSEGSTKIAWAIALKPGNHDTANISYQGVGCLPNDQ